MAYGGIGKNIRWRFIKTSLDADYTDANRFYQEISNVRKTDRTRTETYYGGNDGNSYHVINGAFDGIEVSDGSRSTNRMPVIREFYPHLGDTSMRALTLGSNNAFIRKSTSENNDSADLGFVSILSGNYKYSYKNTDWVNNYITKSGYTKSNANYGNPKISYLFKSLRRGETYRFGIIFYNKYGSASKVKWIQDITVPELYEPGFETFVSHGVSGDNKCIDLTVRPLGIVFDIIGDLPDGIVGYEIVRCNRNLNNIKNVM